MIPESSQQKSNTLQQQFYQYDPVKGTHAKSGICALTVAGLAVAGAATTNYLTQTTQTLFNNTDSALQRSLSLLERVVRENPTISGAVVGISAAGGLIHYAYRKSLKPLCAEQCSSMFQKLAGQVRLNSSEIQNHLESIEAITKKMESLKLSLEEEKIISRSESEKINQYEQQAYRDGVIATLGQVIGFYKAVDYQRQSSNILFMFNYQRFKPSREQTTSSLKNDAYKFCDLIKEKLTPEQLTTLSNIISGMPETPDYYEVKGPVEQKHQHLQAERDTFAKLIKKCQSTNNHLLAKFPMLTEEHSPETLKRFFDFLPE